MVQCCVMRPVVKQDKVTVSLIIMQKFGEKAASACNSFLKDPEGHSFFCPVDDSMYFSCTAGVWLYPGTASLNALSALEKVAPIEFCQLREAQACQTSWTGRATR